MRRRLLAEAIGTCLLVAAVVGSGVMARGLSPGQTGLQLLENTLATVFALVALILALGSVSGAHFNPVVSTVEWARGRMTGRECGGYVVAQVLGAAFGAVLANATFGLPAVSISTNVRGGVALGLGEAVATFGLLLAIHGTLASGSPKATPFAVAGWIGGAYWFTSSTSFANPAVTLARTLSDTFAGIAPESVPKFLLGQAVGGVLGFLALRGLLTSWGALPRVLFVCVHNAGRSQMAAALLRHHGAGRVRVASGGSEPAKRIHPLVVEALREIGVRLAARRPRRVGTAGVRAADVVVTMGCGDACPVVPGKRREDWPVEDPAEKDLATVRRIRDDIDARVRALLASLAT